ncbi:MAG: hypothetical protein IIY05_05215 [Alistipes sp.]|nr:hypothetical protein [Alistipes sp.]
MKRSFNYTFDRKTKILTTITLIVVAVIAVILYLLYTGGFFSAWFISVVMALATLMILSIPRRIVLLDDSLEIQCICDITEIDIREIASIRKVSNREMRWVIRIFGAAGFFGYYGKFFDFKEWDIVTIYASEWNNFVEITDIYDSRIYVSCREADNLINTILQARELCQENDSVQDLPQAM